MTTGLIIKLLRTAERMPQRELASKLGVTRSYLSQLESGKRQPALPLLREVSRLFNVPTALLVMDADESTRPLFEEMRAVLGSILSVKLALTGRDK